MKRALLFINIFLAITNVSLLLYLGLSTSSSPSTSLTNEAEGGKAVVIDTNASTVTGKVADPSYFHWNEEASQARSCLLLIFGFLTLGLWLCLWVEGYKTNNGKIYLILAPIFTLIFLFVLCS